MESKKINQLATELAPDLSDLTIIGDPTTGISKKITLSQMASLFTGTVEEYANFAAFPLVGVADTIYIALNTNIIYRWNTGTSAYVELSPNIVSSLVFNDANGFDGTINLVGSVATLTITTALTTGSVGFIGASGALLQDNANFFWDDTNNRLGLGTNAPTTALDVFGSGIIGRINGTSTNNAYLGFASTGTNKWSVGNVQSDHRFRIFSEANSAELVSVLQTGEFGIGIANPTTKFHIDGAASALIANLDANVSVAKSISFRSDNSNRINLEVSGTESGSNAGANFFLRAYSDAGALLSTPLTILRSTGSIGIGGTPSIFSTNIYFDVYGATTTQGGIIQTKTSNSGVIGSFFADTNGLNIRTETSHPILFTLGGTQRIYISSGGNVGISVTPSAWGSGYIGFQYGTAGSQMSVANNNRIGLNYYFDGAAFRTIQTGTSSLIEFDGDNIYFKNASSVSAGAAQTLISRLLISSSGDLTVNGGASPAKLTLGYNFFILNDQGPEIVSFVAGSGSSIFRWMRQTTTESMRLTSDGNLLIGQTSATGASNGIYLRSGVDSGIVATNDSSLSLYRLSSNGKILRFFYAGSEVGSISSNTNSLPSDFNFKKDIEDISIGLNLVSKLRPIHYRHKLDEDNEPLSNGIIAQELEQSLLECGIEKNSLLMLQHIPNEDETQSQYWVDYTKMIPILIKAIQEQQAQIEELKAKIK